MDYAASYLKRCQALLAAGRGNAELARRLALEAMRPTGRGSRWNELEALRALGLSQLLLGDPEAAAQPLQTVWDRLHDAGVGNPGTFPVGADLAEALALTGRQAEARAVAQQLTDAATAQDHRWAAAAAERAWGHVLLAAGDTEQAALRLQRAGGSVRRHGSGARPGAFPDRTRQRTPTRPAAAAARDALEQAVTSLEALGSPGWAEVARAELARVGGRRGGGELLTATEQQVAQLVLQGLANKQIALRLVVSISTVEAHLTRIYRKLGVASRTELTRMLAEQSVGLSPIPDGELPA